MKPLEYIWPPINKSKQKVHWQKHKDGLEVFVGKLNSYNCCFYHDSSQEQQTECRRVLEHLELIIVYKMKLSFIQ